MNRNSCNNINDCVGGGISYRRHPPLLRHHLLLLATRLKDLLIADNFRKFIIVFDRIGYICVIIYKHKRYDTERNHNIHWCL